MYSVLRSKGVRSTQQCSVELVVNSRAEVNAGLSVNKFNLQFFTLIGEVYIANGASLPISATV